MDSLGIRRITFNIRYAATSLMPNEKPWSTRRPLVVNQLSTTAANAPEGAVTIIGLQEVLDEQLTDIKDGLGSAWTHIGVARDDGKKSGEYNPILYKPSELRLLYNETKWLSPTPDTPSCGWCAGSRRIVVIGVFEHIVSGKRFIAVNTHLDNVSSEARSEGIKVVVARIQAVQATWGQFSIILTGDFNSPPGGDAYQTLQDTGFLTELYTAASASERFGPYETYIGFTTDTTATRIDFIWFGPRADNKWAIDRYQVLLNIQDDVYLSDHRAVVGDLKLL